MFRISMYIYSYICTFEKLPLSYFLGVSQDALTKIWFFLTNHSIKKTNRPQRCVISLTPRPYEDQVMISTPPLPR